MRDARLMGIRGWGNFEFLILNWASLRGAVGLVGPVGRVGPV